MFEFPQRMGPEDFSFYQDEIPGFSLRLGSGNKARGTSAESHTPEFDIDEECLLTGVKVMPNLALVFWSGKRLKDGGSVKMEARSVLKPLL